MTYDRRVRAAVVLSSLVAIADPASADDATDKSEAARLFEEGRTALENGQPEVACKRFEQSLRKDPRAGGTLLNLALCNERQGKVASALALFIEAYDRANEQGNIEQRKAAEQHIATLRPQVPFLVIVRAGAPHTGEKLLIDDQVIALDEREIPIDPGTHDITLTAPGRLPYETQVSVKVSARLKLPLPELEVPRPRLVKESWRRTWGKPLTFGGGALLVLGAGGLVFAKYRYDAQFDDPDGSGPALAHCGSRPQVDGMETCDREGKDRVDSARAIGATSVVVGGIGLVALGIGAFLWSTARDQVVVTPVGPANTAGMSISGRF